MILETLFIYTLSLCIAVALLGKIIIKILKNGIKVLRIKHRPTPPSLISNSRWGTHNYIHLKERGIKLHYVEKGDANNPMILFLHGFPECWFSWRHQLEEFSSRFRVVALDLRGYGDSDKPKRISDYTIKNISEDIKQFILELGDNRCEQKCTIVGHDWGGAIAWQLVVDHPELFKRHISINGPQRGVKSQILRSSLIQLKKSWYIFFFQFPILPELLLRLSDYEDLQQHMRGTRNVLETFPDDVMECYKYYWSQGGLKYPIMYYKAAFRESIEVPKEKIVIPTLIVWGKEDVALSEEIPKRLTKLCTDIQLKWIEGAGHFVHEEEPVLVNKIIGDYLRITD